MHFSCTICRQRLEVEEARAGEYISCPACEHQIRIPRAPIVIIKGARSQGGIRLVPIPASARHLRQGSLAERMAAMKEARSSDTMLSGATQPIML